MNLIVVKSQQLTIGMKHKKAFGLMEGFIGELDYYVGNLSANKSLETMRHQHVFSRLLSTKTDRMLNKALYIESAAVYKLKHHKQILMEYV
jgi:sugar phosphate permease